MNHMSPQKRIWVIMQIIVLMICMLMSNMLVSSAVEPSPATEDDPPAEDTVSTTVATTTTQTIVTTEPTTEATTTEITTVPTSPPTAPPTTAPTVKPTTAPTTRPSTPTTPITRPTGATSPTKPTQPTKPTTPEEKPPLTDEEMAHIQDLQSQRIELQQQISQLESNRLTYSSTLEGLLLQKANLEAQFAIKQQEIDVNTQIRDRLTKRIQINDLDLIRQEQSFLVRRQALLTRFDSLKSRVRALSQTADISMFLLFTGADSYAEYLVDLKLSEQLVSKDRKAIETLEQELAQIIAERDQLESEQTALEEELAPYISAEQSLEHSKRELMSLLEEVALVEEQLSLRIDYYREQYVAVSEEQSGLRMQIADILQNYSSTDMIAPPVMSWPAPECSVITSSFKSRWGRWHYGLDIASWGDSTGKPIVAAADGVVIFAGSDTSGYGNYIIIDHGFDLEGHRTLTLYAHCHELYVDEGDIVFGGQTLIAAVGNTGNSTGPHLHFEVRVDGTAVDPVANGYLILNGITISG